MLHAFFISSNNETSASYANEQFPLVRLLFVALNPFHTQLSIDQSQLAHKTDKQKHSKTAVITTIRLQSSAIGRITEISQQMLQQYMQNIH